MFKKVSLYFFLMVLIFSLGSCTSGEYMSIKSNEKVEILGIIKTNFVVTGSFRYKSVINKQAYMNLLAEAQKEYQGANVDVRDISWVIGEGDAANNNYVYTAIGKVIKL